MADNVLRPLAGRISVWIQDRVHEAGAKGLVLGLSGGIDSSVVAALAKMACGENVLGMIMPCHSSPESSAHAKLVAQKLGVRTHLADLTGAYDVLVPRVSHLQGFELTNVAPRLRMTALYCAAQALGYLVVGTGNKTEISIGYFTKWGDGACDILPLANLYKHQVYALARELEIPQEVIQKPPTADLWEGQTDEGELGITYDELDRTLRAMESGELSDCDPSIVERVKVMISSSEHKRRPIPAFVP